MNLRCIFGAVQALGVALLATTASVSAADAAGARAVAAPRAETAQALDWTSLKLLTTAADAQVQPVIQGREALYEGSPRGVARGVRQLVAPFVWANSTFYHDESLLPPIKEMLDFLRKIQHSDGTYTVGNRHSPPDTGFLVEDFGITVRMLEQDDHQALPPIADSIKAILVKAGHALNTGGIHTPNHRWKVSAGLARISSITDDESLIPRVDEWLAEGIDIDADGIYSERSANYYSAVTNPSLLTIAYELNRTELIADVRKNLELTIEHSDPNGEVETILSRRQDQAQAAGNNLQNFYPVFRELALLDNNGRFSAMVRLIEAQIGPKLGDFLGNLIERPELAAQLPQPEQPFVDFKKHYSAAALVRERRGKLSVSSFGGTDWYDAEGHQTDFYNRIGSGLSTNPTFFRAWNGALVLEAVRLVPNFFSMGHFRADGITYDNDGVARLTSLMKVPYYLPIPADKRNKNGTYAMSRSTVDGRFYSALDFDNRPSSLRRLRTDVAIASTSTGYNLTFDVSGERDVELTLELTLRKNGTLNGVTETGTLKGVEELVDAKGVKTYHLVNGSGQYTLGNDSLTFGPGNGNGLIQADAGEQYSWAGGSLNLDGHKVYITGKSPLKYTLKLGFS